MERGLHKLTEWITEGAFFNKQPLSSAAYAGIYSVNMEISNRTESIRPLSYINGMPVGGKNLFLTRHFQEQRQFHILNLQGKYSAKRQNLLWGSDDYLFRMFDNRFIFRFAGK
jgi:hypothetical protein